MRKTKLISGVIAVLAAVCISFSAVSVSAFADVIWEPEDSFYTRHVSDCSYLDRSFKANSPDEDGLKVYESPESNKVNAVVENGKYVYISYVYTDRAGNNWGLSENQGGWVPMDYLANLYDSTEFYNQYKDQIKDESGEVDLSGLTEDDSFFFYNYPGATSGSKSAVFEDNPSYYRSFTDPEGHKWGYVGYYYIMEGWVCVDNPTATYDELYPNGQTFSGIVEDPGKPSVIVEPVSRINPIIIVCIIVGVIAVASAVTLIVIFNKSKRAKN